MGTEREELGEALGNVVQDLLDGRYGDDKVDLQALRDDLEEALREFDE